jgi:hypothetical protein
MACTGLVKIKESISLEHRFSVIKLHASRSGKEGFANKFSDQSTDRITNEHRVKPGPHKYCLTKQLKNNVHEASLNNLTNYACNWASVEMSF